MLHNTQEVNSLPHKIKTHSPKREHLSMKKATKARGNVKGNEDSKTDVE